MKSFVFSFFSFLFIVVVGFSVFSAPVRAQEQSWSAPTITTFVGAIQKTITGAVNKEGGELHSFYSNLIGIVCMIFGCTSDPKNPLGYQNSAVAGMSGVIASMYGSPPASTYAFAVDIGQSLGFVPKSVNAQGVGFSGLRPLLGVWKVFRNIAYGIIAIIIVIVGFMVMLRTKIDPKTVVSVQNAIPKIVWALILVTFSYAIVGFLIDIMYVLMLLLASMLIGPYSDLYTNLSDMLKLVDPLKVVPQVFPVTPDLFISSGFTSTMSVFFHGGVTSFWGILKLFPVGAHVVGSVMTGLIGFLFTGLGVKGAILGAFAPQLLILFIIAIATIMGLVRLFFLLLDAYINIIVALLISPLQLMLEAVPGVDAFGSWMKNLVSKLLVFPTTVALLLITFYLTTIGDTGALWAPPLLWGSPAGSSEGLSGLIGLGMLLSIPTIVGSLQKLLKAEPVIPAGIGPILGPMTSGMGQLINLYYQFSMIKAYSRKEHAPSPYQQAMGAGNQNLGNILKGGGGEQH
ncbi:MAG: hypothetical protein Q8L37_04225 [Candidatus Gottesmanbacteria bacterium]|nr:hypothetical protein [Candidatus Gottesmanbacteria bacterium]